MGNGNFRGGYNDNRDKDRVGGFDRRGGGSYDYRSGFDRRGGQENNRDRGGFEFGRGSDNRGFDRGSGPSKSFGSSSSSGTRPRLQLKARTAALPLPEKKFDGIENTKMKTSDESNGKATSKQENSSSEQGKNSPAFAAATVAERLDSSESK